MLLLYLKLYNGSIPPLGKAKLFNTPFKTLSYSSPSLLSQSPLLTSLHFHVTHLVSRTACSAFLHSASLQKSCCICLEQALCPPSRDCQVQNSTQMGHAPGETFSHPSLQSGFHYSPVQVFLHSDHHTLNFLKARNMSFILVCSLCGCFYKWALLWALGMQKWVRHHLCPWGSHSVEDETETSTHNYSAIWWVPHYRYF